MVAAGAGGGCVCMAGVGRGRKVSTGVRSVCHHGVINTQWGWSKGRRRWGPPSERGEIANPGFLIQPVIIFDTSHLQ